MPIVKDAKSLLKFSPSSLKPKKAKSAGKKGGVKKPKPPLGVTTRPKEDIEPFMGIRMPQVSQENPMWCWAACALMVADYLQLFSTPPTQEMIVESAFHTHDPMRSASGPEILGVYHKGHVGGVRIDCRLTGALTQMQLDDELTRDGGGVVQLAVRWDRFNEGAGGHVLMIAGFSPASTDSETFYFVDDPDGNTRFRVASFSGLMAAFNVGQGRGFWNESLLGFAEM